MIGIYRIVNKIDGKCYIGQSTNIKKRWNEHRRYFNYPQYANSLLYDAIRKYGLQNFSFEVLEECDITSLDEKEKHWIEAFNSHEDGYNMDTGGRTVSDSDREIIRCMWKKGFSVGEIANHVVCSGVSVSRFVRFSDWYDKKDSAKRSKAWRKKPVFQYGIDGTFLRGFPSIDDAGRKTGVRPDTISACCNKRCSKSAGGYQWSFEKLARLNAYNPYAGSREKKEVLQYTKDGHLIGKYEGISDACRKTGINRSSISRSCHGIQKYGKGFIWKFSVTDHG